MLYRVDYDGDLSDTLTNNYITALEQLIYVMQSHTNTEFENLRKNGKWYAIHSYNGLIDDATWSDYFNNRTWDIDDPDELFEIKENEFNDYKFEYNFKRATDFELEHFYEITSLYLKLRKTYNILEREHIIMDDLQTECHRMCRDSEWYGDCIPEQWIRKLSSAMFNYPDDMYYFSHTYEQVLEMIDETYEDYWKNLSE